MRRKGEGEKVRLRMRKRVKVNGAVERRSRFCIYLG